MLSKIDAINLVQLQLASGKFPADLRGKYPIPVVSRILNGVFADICKHNARARTETAIEFTFTVSGDCDSGFYSTLSPRPLLGAASIEYVLDGTRKIDLRHKGMQQALITLRGGVESGTCWLKTPARLEFPHSPENTSITVCMVPNIYEMSDTDMICADTFENHLIGATIAFMRANDIRPQDMLNDSKVDAG